MSENPRDALRVLEKEFKSCRINIFKAIAELDKKLDKILYILEAKGE